jgi:protein CWC15
MTTAHRPTWNSARGGSEQGGNQLVQPKRNYSALDMPAHLKLKVRSEAQGSKEVQGLIDFKDQLLKREREVAESKNYYRD